jgi:hypothetical protein
MRVLRLPALLLVAVAVGAGAGVVGCSQKVAGTGTLAVGMASDGRSPSGSTDSPSPGPSGTESGSPTPTPSPTPDPVTARRRVLCVLERASITSVNSQFNKAKTRDAQISVLRKGSTTITGHLRGSKLPTSDRIYAYGKAVLSQLNNLIRVARVGGSPSTTPYNAATTNLQKACGTL